MNSARFTMAETPERIGEEDMTGQSGDRFDPSEPVESRLASAGLTQSNSNYKPGTPGDPLCARPFTAFDGKSLEAKIQELADREEIRELVANYANRIARGVPASDLFTEDGGFSLKTPGQPVQVVSGGESVRKMYAMIRPEDDHPLPMIHNIQLVIEGDEAFGLCSNEIRAISAGKSVIGSGYYEDRFRRVGGRWKFVQRDATMFHWVPLDEGWADKG